MAEYEQKMNDIVEIPASDDLIAGRVESANVPIMAGEYTRGDVMVEADDGYKAAQSVDELSSAKSLGVMSTTITIPEGESGSCAIYVYGRLNMRRIRVGGQSLREYTAQEQNKVIQYMLRGKMILD